MYVIAKVSNLDSLIFACSLSQWQLLLYLRIIFFFTFQPKFSLPTSSHTVPPPAHHHPFLPTHKGYYGDSTKFGTLSWSRTQPLHPVLRMSMTSIIGNGLQQSNSCTRARSWSYCQGPSDSPSFTTVFHIWRAQFSLMENSQMSSQSS